MCEYKYCNGKNCLHDPLPGSNYCVLHQDFPDQIGDKEFDELKKMKQQEIEDMVSSGDFNFEGAKLADFDMNSINQIREANFGHVTFYGNVNFSDLKFCGPSNFQNAIFRQSVSFDRTKFCDSVNFGDAIFENTAQFHETIFGGNARFWNTKFNSDAQFWKSEFSKKSRFFYAYFQDGAFFNSSKFLGRTWFNKAHFCGHVNFESCFFGEEANFISTKIDGQMNIANAMFARVDVEESVSRVAKKRWEELGDKSQADTYYYREMEAKRKQKCSINRYLEYIFIQSIFGYGVKPLRTFSVYILFILSFALIYHFGSAFSGSESIISCLYISTTTAMTPGFGGYSIKPDFQIYAIIEAIFGTFMWASFLAIFGRKYMR